MTLVLLKRQTGSWGVWNSLFQSLSSMVSMPLTVLKQMQKGKRRQLHLVVYLEMCLSWGNVWFCPRTCLVINFGKAQIGDAGADGESIGLGETAVWCSWRHSFVFLMVGGLDKGMELCFREKGVRVQRWGMDSTCMCKLSRAELRMDLHLCWYPDKPMVRNPCLGAMFFQTTPQSDRRVWGDLCPSLCVLPSPRSCSLPCTGDDADTQEFGRRLLSAPVPWRWHYINSRKVNKERGSCHWGIVRQSGMKAASHSCRKEFFRSARRI